MSAEVPVDRRRMRIIIHQTLPTCLTHSWGWRGGGVFFTEVKPLVKKITIKV